MTIRTKTYLTGTSYVAGQAAGSIGSDDHRDFVESVDSWIGPAFVALTSGTTVTWATAGEKVNNATLTLAHNATLDITGEVAGASGWLEITQDATGGRTFTLPAGTVVGATTAINTTANKKSAVLWTYNGTSFWFIIAQEV
jgi:plastocyanin